MMPPGEKIKVLIVDDHQVVRQGLRTFLELQEDWQLVIHETLRSGVAEDRKSVV